MRISHGLQVALPVRTRYHVRHMNTVATTRVERPIRGTGEDALLSVPDTIRSRLFASVSAEYFRQFNGHTQVNATDLRNVPFPTESQLRAIGSLIADAGAEQDEVDRVVTKETALPSSPHSRIGRPWAAFSVRFPGRRRSGSPAIRYQHRTTHVQRHPEFVSLWVCGSRRAAFDRSRRAHPGSTEATVIRSPFVRQCHSPQAPHGCSAWLSIFALLCV